MQGVRGVRHSPTLLFPINMHSHLTDNGTNTQRYRGFMRPDHNQMKAETQGFHLVMVWPRETSIPLSSGSRCPLKLSAY